MGGCGGSSSGRGGARHGGLLVPGPGRGWRGSAVRDLLLMLLRPHPSPRARGGLHASGREEVTLTNKQGGGWCAPRQGAEGVPGGFLP